MESLLELFVNVDDFCQVFLPFWEQNSSRMAAKNAAEQGN